MSSHPQSVPTTRRTVEPRHLPNPATLPLQLQRAHTVRRPAEPPTVHASLRVKPWKRFYWISGSGSVCLVGYLVNKTLLWTGGEPDLRDPTGVYPTHIPTLWCCAHKAAPSLDVNPNSGRSLPLFPRLCTYCGQSCLCFKEGATGWCGDLFSDLKYLQNCLFQYGIRGENMTGKIPASATMLSPTNYSSDISEGMGVDRLCPAGFLSDRRCTLSVGPMVPGWERKWQEFEPRSAGMRWEIKMFYLHVKGGWLPLWLFFFFFSRKWDWLTTTLIMSETTAPTWPNRTADGLLSSQSFSLEMKG